MARGAKQRFTNIEMIAITLIEIIGAIAIIAILTAMLFPVFSTVRVKAQQSACPSNMKQFPPPPGAGSITTCWRLIKGQ